MEHDYYKQPELAVSQVLSWSGALSADLSPPGRGYGDPSSARPGHVSLRSPSMTVTPGGLDLPNLRGDCPGWAGGRTVLLGGPQTCSFLEKISHSSSREVSAESKDHFYSCGPDVSSRDNPALGFLFCFLPGMKCDHWSIKCHSTCICVYV